MKYSIETNQPIPVEVRNYIEEMGQIAKHSVAPEVTSDTSIATGATPLPRILSLIAQSGVNARVYSISSQNGSRLPVSSWERTYGGQGENNTGSKNKRAIPKSWDGSHIGPQLTFKEVYESWVHRETSSTDRSEQQKDRSPSQSDSQTEPPLCPQEASYYEQLYLLPIERAVSLDDALAIVCSYANGIDHHERPVKQWHLVTFEQTEEGKIVPSFLLLNYICPELEEKVQDRCRNASTVDEFAQQENWSVFNKACKRLISGSPDTREQLLNLAAINS